MKISRRLRHGLFKTDPSPSPTAPSGLRTDCGGHAGHQFRSGSDPGHLQHRSAVPEACPEPARRPPKSQIDAFAMREQESIRQSVRWAVAELAVLLIATVLFVIRLVAELGRNNVSIPMSEQPERQRDRILEQGGRTESLETVFDGLLTLVGRHWPECSSRKRGRNLSARPRVK